MLVFVDPMDRLIRVLTRMPGKENSWIDGGSGAPHDGPLACLGITLGESEIFTRD
jgi:hypothetical protein